MRQEKTLEFTDRQVTVKELRVRDIWEMDQNDTAGLAWIERLLTACTGLTWSDLLDFYPSEIRTLWEAIQEVNASFLATADQFGLTNIWKQAAQKTLTNLAQLFAGSLPEATAPESGNTDGDSSGRH